MDQLTEENDKYNRASLDDFELGRLLGYGCNAAVYEARLRSSIEGTARLTFPSDFITIDENNSESDIEILSRQSSNTSSYYEDANDNLDDEQRLNELALKEGRMHIYYYEKKINGIYHRKKNSKIITLKICCFFVSNLNKVTFLGIPF